MSCWNLHLGLLLVLKSCREILQCILLSAATLRDVWHTDIVHGDQRRMLNSVVTKLQQPCPFSNMCVCVGVPQDGFPLHVVVSHGFEECVRDLVGASDANKQDFQASIVVTCAVA